VKIWTEDRVWFLRSHWDLCDDAQKILNFSIPLGTLIERLLVFPLCRFPFLSCYCIHGQLDITACCVLQQLYFRVTRLYKLKWAGCGLEKMLYICTWDLCILVLHHCISDTQHDSMNWSLKSNTRSYTIHTWQLNSPKEPILLGIYPIQFEMSSTEDMVKWGDHCTMELAQQGLIHVKNDEMGLVVWATRPSSSWSPKNMSSLVSGMGLWAQQGWFHLRTCQAWQGERAKPGTVRHHSIRW